MELSTFYFSSNAYGYKHIEFNYNNKTSLFEYRNNHPIGGVMIDGPYILYRRSNPLEEQLITVLTDHPEDLQINPILVEAFVKYIKQYCKHWKKEYKEDILDGEGWEFHLKSDDFEFKSNGHMAWPGNFETFRHKLTQLTGGKMF